MMSKILLFPQQHMRQAASSFSQLKTRKSQLASRGTRLKTQNFQELSLESNFATHE